MFFEFDLLFRGVSSLVIGVTFSSFGRFKLHSLKTSLDALLTSSLSLTEID
jgi:hypothetical protein